MRGGAFRDSTERRDQYTFRHYEDPHLYLEQYLLENSYTGTYAASKTKQKTDANRPGRRHSLPSTRPATHFSTGGKSCLLGVCHCRPKKEAQRSHLSGIAYCPTGNETGPAPGYRKIETEDKTDTLLLPRAGGRQPMAKDNVMWKAGAAW